MGVLQGPTSHGGDGQYFKAWPQTSPSPSGCGASPFSFSGWEDGKASGSLPPPTPVSPAAPLKLEGSPILSQGRKAKVDDHRSRPGRPAVSRKRRAWSAAPAEGPEEGPGEGPQRSSRAREGPPGGRGAGAARDRQISREELGGLAKHGWKCRRRLCGGGRWRGSPLPWSPVPGAAKGGRRSGCWAGGSAGCVCVCVQEQPNLFLFPPPPLFFFLLHDSEL